MDHLAASLFSLLVWWFSTGAILWLDRLPQATFRWSMLGATLVAIVAMRGLVWSSQEASVAGAYCAFTCAVAVWGWQEMAFLMGYVTGPRRSACAPHCRGGQHFRHGVEAVLYHELALIVCLVMIGWATWGGANQIGLTTFAMLWVLRLSAKLNLFLGVPNSGSELLPGHLQYLDSFFSKRAMNLLFPVSITLSTVWATSLWLRVGETDASAFSMTGLTLLAALASLAVLEHWLMVLPLDTSRMWAWVVGSSRAAAKPSKERKVARGHFTPTAIDAPMAAAMPSVSTRPELITG